MLRPFVGGVRDLWLIFGVCLLLVVGVEALYRAQGAVRRQLGGSGIAASHPYADSAWFGSFESEEARSDDVAWRPYVYFRRVPSAGRFINVDSSGRRITVQRPPARSDRRLDVFMFGGSTMFGTANRDSATIPSVVARTLETRGMHGASVTNFGEVGYVMTQGLLELMLQLRSGARPAVVVFYDGINDVSALVQNGRPGLPQNEGNRAADFELGRSAFNHETDLLAEARAIGSGMAVVAGRLQWFERIKRFRGAPPQEVDGDAAALALVEDYTATVRMVESLGHEFGFRTIYAWQPALHGNSKPPTAFEQTLLEEIERSAFHSNLRAVHRSVPGRLEAAMSALVPGRFLNLSAIFAEDSSNVFVDVIGHTTEAASARIASALSEAIERELLEVRGVATTPP